MISRFFNIYFDQEVTYLLVGGAGVYYGLLENEYRVHIYGFLLSLLSLFVWIWLNSSYYIYPELAQTMIYLSSASLGIFTVLRFWKRPNKWRLASIVKVIVMAELLFYILFDYFELINHALFQVGLVYVLSRINWNPNKKEMIKNIIIVLLILGTVFFTTYAYLQKGYAEENLREAERMHRIAVERSTDNAELLMEQQQKIDSLSAIVAGCQGE
ncbi:MAG: hypothetical protein ABJN36_13810 [Cyclobacteriaceae bacterium]